MVFESQSESAMLSGLRPEVRHLTLLYLTSHQVTIVQQVRLAPTELEQGSHATFAKYQIRLPNSILKRHVVYRSRASFLRQLV